MSLLSIIIPSYNEEQLIHKTAQIICELMEKNAVKSELLFIDDGSRDRTWDEIVKVSQEYSNIIGIHFSRNFGKEAAMFAGLERASGDCCVIIDCDLQHPPEKIIEMYHLWEQGYEIVEGIKIGRGEESKVHTFAANVFYSLISKATKMDLKDSSDFKLLDRKVVESLNQISERHVFFRALSHWVGYKQTTVSFEVADREAGETKWSVVSLIKYAVSNITSNTSFPLQIISILGSILLVGDLVYVAFLLVTYMTEGGVDKLDLIVMILLFICAAVMLGMGIIGHYIAKIYEEVQGRPRYLVSTVCGKYKS